MGKGKDAVRLRGLKGAWTGSRREFLERSSLLPFLAAPLRLRPSVAANPFPFPAFDADSQSLFRLQPVYRAPGPLADILTKVDPALDVYPSEQFAAKIGVVLEGWAQALRRSRLDGIRAIRESLADNLQASSRLPSEDRIVRSDKLLDIRRLRFSPSVTLGRDAFLKSLNDRLAEFAALDAVNLELSQIFISTEGPTTLLRTRIHYKFAGRGTHCYRAEQLGVAEVEWREVSPARFEVARWGATEETETRALGPVYQEITAKALAGVGAYRSQFAHGADYWRTVLDAASGIDVYGNFGIAAGDFDNDGFDDLYVCQAAGLPNRLLRNRGDGTFEDVTEKAGVAILDYTTFALFADVLNRGLQDLLVITINKPLLYLNQGNGTFRLKPDAFKFNRKVEGTFTGAAFGDYDRDGRLDVYFCTYNFYEGFGKYSYPTPYCDAQNGPPNFLFHNQGDGTFLDVTSKTGMDQNNDHLSFDCHWCDYDGDGWLDLYVANDFGRKNLYHNNGNGTFKDVAEEAGVLDIGPGMSACWFDYDNDGKPDLYVSNMWEAAGRRFSTQPDFMPATPPAMRDLYRRFALGNSLFHNQGDGRFEDRSKASGAEISGWSWSSQDWDFDHDGYSDLYIANGFVSGPNPKNLESFLWRQVVSKSPIKGRSKEYGLGWDAINDLIQCDRTWAGYQRNVFYINNHDGSFTEAAGALGLDFVDDSRAFALADFDHDGRPEIFLKNRSGPQLRILRNVAEGIGDSLAVRLHGKQSNRDAIGAWVVVESGGIVQTKLVKSGSGFCSQSSKELFFGLGQGSQTARVTVRWPMGGSQTFEGVPQNHRIEIEEGVATFRAEPFAAPAWPHEAESTPPHENPLPTIFSTWLIAPLEAPDFSLPDASGRVQTLSATRGAPVLLIFWMAGSEASLGSLRAFERQLSQAKQKRLQILAINVESPDVAARNKAIRRGRHFSFPVLQASDDVAAIYNLLFRYMYDRHQNLPIPSAFLLDEQGLVAKVYQGAVTPSQAFEDTAKIPRTPAERQKLALPFRGFSRIGFTRNNFTYGLVFAQHGYREPAERAFLAALREDPSMSDACYDLGTLYLQQEKWDAANEMLLKAVQLKPNDFMALNNLGIIAIHQGNRPAAERYFKQVLKQHPENALAIGNLADLYRSSGRSGKAKQILQSALERHPDNPELNYKLGMIYADQGSLPEAEQYLEKVIRLDPSNVKALDNLGVAYALTGELDRAADAFSKCIRIAPNYDSAYLDLARTDVRLGKTDQAIQVLKALLVQVPGHPVAEQYLKTLESQ